MRAFGLYLSSNVLVCISIDRFFAVLYPLKLSVARRRSRQMLCGAWAAALACSLPQSAVFRVLQHPRVAGFEQCVSFGAFPSARLELAYNVFCLAAMYFLPLLVITACYVCIFIEIRRSSNDLSDLRATQVRRVRLRRSEGAGGAGGVGCTGGAGVLQRARRRTLRMTVTIVAVFALCWLPYATMAMWVVLPQVHGGPGVGVARAGAGAGPAVRGGGQQLVHEPARVRLVRAAPAPRRPPRRASLPRARLLPPGGQYSRKHAVELDPEQEQQWRYATGQDVPGRSHPASAGAVRGDGDGDGDDGGGAGPARASVTAACAPAVRATRAPPRAAPRAPRAARRLLRVSRCDPI